MQLWVTAGLGLSSVSAERKSETREESEKEEEWVVQMFSHKRWKEKVTHNIVVTFSNIVAQLQLHTNINVI